MCKQCGNMAHGGIVKDDEDQDAAINYDPMMPHMDDGGIAGMPDDFTVATGDSDTVKGIPPPAIHNPIDIDTAVPPPSAPLQAMKPPVSAAPSRAMPGMPPGVTPDALQQLLAAQKAGLEKYSPDKGFNATQAMLQARTGLGGSLANAGATLADGIMQGVARAGNPGFAAAQEARAQNLTGAQAENYEQARKGTMEQTEAEQKIDMNDPTAPLSRAAQAAYGPTLMSMGASKQQVAMMPASLISEVANKNVTLTEALSRIQQEGTYQRGMLANTAAQRQQQADEFRTQHPILSKLSGFGGGGKSDTAAPASPPKNFASVEDAEAAGLPPGTRVSINGRMGTVK